MKGGASGKVVLALAAMVLALGGVAGFVGRAQILEVR